jgi:hypothetical protein
MTHRLHDWVMAGVGKIPWRKVPHRLHGIENPQKSDVAGMRVLFSEFPNFFFLPSQRLGAPFLFKVFEI